MLQGKKEPREQRLHINLLEMRAVTKALQVSSLPLIAMILVYSRHLHCDLLLQQQWGRGGDTHSLSPSGQSRRSFPADLQLAYLFVGCPSLMPGSMKSALWQLPWLSGAAWTQRSFCQAAWASHSTYSDLYLWDITLMTEDLHRLGPFPAAKCSSCSKIPNSAGLLPVLCPSYLC